jgi:hypothetical protein
MLVDALRLAGWERMQLELPGLALVGHRPAWRAACCVVRHLLQRPVAAYLIPGRTRPDS